jgi:predicted PurR-regulated permease PerM
LITFGHTGSVGDALIVAAVYLAVVGVEGYVVTPYVMGRSLDMNGTTVLIACLFWGFLWGLAGLVLAMPITVGLKLVFQSVPELNRWAELMSRDWQTPSAIPILEPLPAQPEPSLAREPQSARS